MCVTIFTGKLASCTGCAMLYKPSGSLSREIMITMHTHIDIYMCMYFEAHACAEALD